MATAARAIKPIPTRRDPAPKKTDRSLLTGAIRNGDPNRVYVWVYKVGDQIGYYEAMGYDVELRRPDGPRCAVERKKGLADGVPIEFQSNVLMSIGREEYDEMQAEGQSQVDEMERRIIGKVSGEDGLRGIAGIRGRDNMPVLGLENKTKSPEVELE